MEGYCRCLQRANSQAGELRYRRSASPEARAARKRRWILNPVPTGICIQEVDLLRPGVTVVTGEAWTDNAAVATLPAS
jgi:hypothetical protein